MQPAVTDVNSVTPISAGLTRVCKSRRRILHFRVNILSFTRREYIKAKNPVRPSVKVWPFNSIITRLLRTSDSTFITFYFEAADLYGIRHTSVASNKIHLRHFFYCARVNYTKNLECNLPLFWGKRTTYRQRFVMLICRGKIHLPRCILIIIPCFFSSFIYDNLLLLQAQQWYFF